MGIPGYYKWMIHRFPKVGSKCIHKHPFEVEGSVDATLENPNKIEFDNLYLDLNGIIHISTHSDERATTPTSMDEVKSLIREYIDHVFNMIRPRKLIFLAIDGVAPRAKMNQQRSRRFMSAREQEKKRKKLSNEEMESIPNELMGFDSNLISPGTEFMDGINEMLHAYVQDRIQNNAAWKKLTVIVSDCYDPGEGEHKIMNFARSLLSQPSYDPNLKHVFYGADADFLMLALALHEPQIYVLRENPFEVRCFRCYKYGHMAFECTSKKAVIPKDIDNENNTTVHVGNLPYTVQKEELADLFSKCGPIKDIRIVFDRETLKSKGFAFVELETHDAARNALNLHGTAFNGRKLKVSFAKQKENVPVDITDEILAQFQSITGLAVEESIQFLSKTKGNVEAAVTLFFEPESKDEDLDLQKELLAISNMETKKEIQMEAPTRKKPHFILLSISTFREYLYYYFEPLDMEHFERIIDDFILFCMLAGNDFLPSLYGLDVFDGGIELLIHIYKRVMKYPSTITQDGEIKLEEFTQFLGALSSVEDLVFDKKSKRKQKKDAKRKERAALRKQKKEGAKMDSETNNKEEKAEQDSGKEEDISDDDEGTQSPSGGVIEKDILVNPEKEEEEFDQVNPRFRNAWREKYYKKNFSQPDIDDNFLNKLCDSYIAALKWVFDYYFKGCPSWNWYYPYYFPPFSSDLFRYISSLTKLSISFEKSAPFTPYQQLMAILPPESIKRALPQPFHDLCSSESSPIGQYYPSQFPITSFNAKYAYPILGFINEKVFLETINPVISSLNDEEKKRNRNLPAVLYVHEQHPFKSIIAKTMNQETAELRETYIYGYLTKEEERHCQNTIVHSRFNLFDSNQVKTSQKPPSQPFSLTKAEIEGGKSDFNINQLQTLSCNKCGKLGLCSEVCKEESSKEEKAESME